MRRGPAAAVAHALRVRDGRDRVLRALGGRGGHRRRARAAGNFHSYNVRGGAERGRIAFVRFADLMR